MQVAAIRALFCLAEMATCQKSSISCDSGHPVPCALLSNPGYQNHAVIPSLRHSCDIPGLLGSSLSLLLNVRLGTTLQRLAGIVLLLVFGLSSLITREASDSTTNGASDTVADASTQVRELAAGLLLLSLEVLLAA